MTEQPTLITSIVAAAALTKGYFIGFDGNVCGAGAKALGVCNADSDSGEMAPVLAKGIALVVSAAAIAVGAALVSDASGQATTATTFAAAAPAITVDDTKLTVDSGATGVTSSAANGAIISAAEGLLTPAAPALTGSVLPQAINGYALDAATAAGDLIRVLLV
ncbi:MAG: DUF2190 family protein [Candidatus Edwardsbacteria bacterium]|nr:DUF2190 family protein [Candidatus Edwardsbacteria bacterium]